MNELINNLPSVGQMFKLIVFLLLALVIFAIVAAIVKMLLPVAIVGAIIYGVYWFLTRDGDKAKVKNG
jgi:hypothetical protein